MTGTTTAQRIADLEADIARLWRDRDDAMTMSELVGLQARLDAARSANNPRGPSSSNSAARHPTYLTVSLSDENGDHPDPRERS